MKALSTLFLLLLISMPTFAQDCTTNKPCGPVPWRIPQLPRLLTPTPAPISSSGAFFGPTPVIEEDSGYVQDVGIDGSDLNDQIGTLNDLLSNENTLNGTDQDLGSLVNNTGDFFGYLRAFASADLGPFTPILAVTILGFGIRMGLSLTTAIVPIVVAIYGLIRKAITLILDFLPL